MTKIISTICLLLLAGYLMGQRTISGTVTDETGEPLIGANVLVKNTLVGTTADLDGTYNLQLPEGSNVLVVSYTGYETQEKTVSASDVLNFVLNQGVLLEEAIITAIGIRREKRALGYAVTELDGSQVNQVAEPDPLRAMQGKVPGVNISGSSGAPGSSTRITIRGNSSLLGDNQPLFVVDGIPYDNTEYNTSNRLSAGGASSSRIADLDPNNIESINVLRGAAAAALYGSRAANGVVLITTKTGAADFSRKGLEISLSSSIAMEEIANLPNLQNTYGTGTNFSYAQANGSWGAPFIGTRPYATLDSIRHWYSGRPGMEQFDGVMVPYQAYPDNVAKLFNTGYVYDNSLSISGGNENASIAATLSFLRNDGYVPNTRFDRASLSLGGNAILENGFRVGMNLSYTTTQQDGVIQGIGGSGANNNSAFARSLLLGRNWDIHGQPYQNPVDLGSEFMIGRGTADNPLWSYENAGIKTNVDRIVASFSLSKDINSWMSLDYRLGVNSYSQRNIDFIRPGSTGPRANPGVGQVIDDDIAFQEIESNVFLSISRDLTEDVSLRAVLGSNINQRKTDRQAFQGLNYVVFDIDDLDNTNNVVPFGGGFSKQRIIGAYADVNLGYQDWAFVTFTGRNDWSSTLPVENRSYFYSGVSGSVILTEALDLQSSFLRYVKLRGGWAQVGNDTGPYLLDPVFFINSPLVTTPAPTASLPFQATGSPASVAGATLENTERNPVLKPERTTEIEFGIEARLINSRVGLDVTYYDRTSKDQIASITLPSESGFTALFTNFGEVSNKGIEVGLDLTPVQSPGGFSWNIYTAFTRNKNLVETLTEGLQEIQISPGTSFAGSVGAYLIPGEEYGILKGSVDLRDDAGNLLIDPSNGQLIQSLEPGVIGNPNPDFQIGVTNTFRYKGFRISGVFDWKQGGDLWSNTVLSMLGRGVLAFQADREINQIIPGVYGDPNTQLPILDESGNTIRNQTMIENNTLWFGQTFAANSSDEWNVYDATVYRLREVSLGYSLPRSLLSNSPFGSVDISLTGRNLWYKAPHFPDDANFDPEVNQFGAANNQGIEYGTTPTTKRYAVNLRVTF